MSKKIKWEKLPKDEKQKYMDRAMFPPMEIMEAAEKPISWVDMKAFTESITKHDEEFETKRLNLESTFEALGRELYEDNSKEIAKWFLVDDYEQYIEQISVLVNGKRGKDLYAVVLAMQKKKHLKSIGYDELSELFRVLSYVFDIPDSRKSLQDAHRNYQRMGARHIKDETIADIEEKLPDN